MYIVQVLDQQSAADVKRRPSKRHHKRRWWWVSVVLEPYAHYQILNLLTHMGLGQMADHGPTTTHC